MRSTRSPKTLAALVSTAMLIAATPSAATLAAPAPLAALAPIDTVESTYLMRCGGCHGIEGRSVQALIPDLRNRVGIFACTQEGRDYILRVPNVTMSGIDDDRLLAEVMNFVIFRLGGASTPPDTVRFTAAEIRGARTRPIDSTNLASLRIRVLDRARAACTAGRGTGARQSSASSK